MHVGQAEDLKGQVKGTFDFFLLFFAMFRLPKTGG